MANKSKVQSNEARIRMVSRDEGKRKALKEIIMNRDLPVAERFDAQMKLSKMPRNGAKVRVRNRCQICGRPRGYIGEFKMSRIWFRYYAGQGELPGLTKSSW
jgi:small subunit ribosomal protein S14